MKERIKKIIQNKYFRFFLPIFLFLFFEYGEKFIDIIIGDGDGIISSQLFIKSHYMLNIIFISWAIFNVFSIALRMGRKATIFNLAILCLILYGFNFYLKKQDQFLKGPFDSNYYYGNLIKYGNFFTPPAGYKKENVITWGNKVKRNRYGFRADEITLKPKGVFRVMVLGDSFTWGAGLAEHEMYTSVLDSLLKNYFKYQKIEVVNCALSGSPTTTERDILRKLKDTVQPDLIVVGFCLNDPQQKNEDYSEEKERFIKKWDALFTQIKTDFSLLHLNYIGDEIVKAVYNYNDRKGAWPDWHTSLGRAYDTKSKNWKDFIRALTDIKNISDSLNCPSPIIGIFNQVSSINYHAEMSLQGQRGLAITLSWLHQVYVAASKIGFEAINYYPMIDKEVLNKKLTIENAKVNPLDGHPSALLDAIYAKEIFERAKPLIENKLNESQTKDQKK
jgi:lysophospholipase L1-like esterase